MEPTQCTETSVFNTQTPGKYPEDNLSLQQHGESLKTITYSLTTTDNAANNIIVDGTISIANVTTNITILST
jgi:hypothetical protein